MDTFEKEAEWRKRDLDKMPQKEGQHIKEQRIRKLLASTHLSTEEIATLVEVSYDFVEQIKHTLSAK